MLLTSQNKISVMLRSSIIMLILLFFSFSVSAIMSGTAPLNGDWLTWGNGGSLYTGDAGDNLFFGSNFPTGNINFSKVTITQGTDVSPLIGDFDNDAQNDIIIVSSGVMYAYDNTGTLTDTYGLNGSVCGQPCVSNVDSDSLQEIAVMQKSGALYNLYFLNLNNGAFEIKRKMYSSLFTLTSTPTCDLFCGVEYAEQDRVFMPYTNMDIFEYDYSSDSSTEHISPVSTTLSRLNGAGYVNGGISSGKITPSGNIKLCYIGKTVGQTTFTVMLYDTVSDEFTYGTYSSSATTLANRTCTIANIGAGGSSELITTESVPTSSVRRLTVWDSAFTQKLELAGGGTVSSPKGLFAIADINHDGSNELCYQLNDTAISCYNQNYVKIQDINIFSGGNVSGYFAIGEYLNSNNQSEIMTSSGLHEIINGSNLNRLYDFGLTAGIGGGFAPVRVLSRTAALQDIVYYSSTQLILFIAGGQSVECGDSVCSIGENIFSCPLDCSPVYDPNQTAGTLQKGHTCVQDSDCISGVCRANICIGKQGGESCTTDAECASDDCDNALGVCAAQDMVGSIDSAAEMFGFRSAGDKMLFAFLCIVIITISAMTTGARLGGFFGAVLAGVIGFIFSLIAAVVLFAWIGIWILFIVIFIVIAVVSLAFYFSSSSGG